MSLIGRKPPTPAELDPLGYWSKPKPAPTLGAYMAGPTAEIRPVKVAGGYVPSKPAGKWVETFPHLPGNARSEHFVPSRPLSPGLDMPRGGYDSGVIGPFPGPRTPRQLRSSVAKAKKSARIYAPAVHPKYGPAKYDLHTIVVPGKRVTIVGILPPGHRYIGPKHEVNTRPMQIRRVFRMGDVALTHGHNLDYMGRIRGITAKQVKVVEHEGMGTGRDKVFHMSLYDFAEKNAFFDEEKSRKRNAEWTD